MLVVLGDAILLIEGMADFGVTGNGGYFVTLTNRDEVSYKARQSVFSFCLSSCLSLCGPDCLIRLII